MQLEHIAQAAISHLLGRFIRRAVFALILIGCAIVALYHFTVAGLMALDAHAGVLHARLIVAGVYTVFAAISAGVVFLWRQPLNGSAKTLTSPREMQLIMLVEAVMLGYELARKGVRAR
jgi:nitrate reductase gamma subunit